MKTIKQIADELGVSKQAVHQKIKKEPLSKNLQEFTSTIDGVINISIDGENLIKQAFNIKHPSIVDVNKSSTVDSRVDDDLINLLKENLSVLQRQLDKKDNQINTLLEQLSEKDKQLNTAQSLHAGTLQQQLANSNSDEQQNEQTNNSKTGFWSGLFSKKKTNN